VHRYVYHDRVFPGTYRIYDIHEKGHHHTIFPTWRYVTNGPVRRHPILSPSISLLYSSKLRNLGVKALHAAFYFALAGVLIWLPAWLLTQHVPFLMGMFVATLTVSDLFVRVHDAMHYPAHNRFIRAQPWFPFLARHHYIHHVDTNVNVNFLLPLADFLFGTMRRTLTTDELARHGSMEEATAVPVGASEPAREVAKPRAPHRLGLK
jgi:sterol desaturase/sphingolipid hydroxylase (fatty acid hydroxylase superfamily)